MSLVGSLEDLGLGDILQIVSLSRKSGVLRLRCDGGEGRIVLQDGMVLGAAVKGDFEDTEAVLLSGGHATEAEIDDALAQGGGAASLSDALSASGVLSEEQLEAICRTRVESAVMGMFDWRAGEFTFEVRDLVDGSERAVLLTSPLSTQYIAMEATRKRDEIEHFGDEPFDDDGMLFSGERVCEDPVDGLAMGTAERVAALDTEVDENDSTQSFATPPVVLEAADAPYATEDETNVAQRELASARRAGLEGALSTSAPMGPEAVSGTPLDRVETKADDAPVATPEERGHLIVIDPDLGALEWLKTSVEGLFERVHIFQRAEIGVDRIRHYLGRGVTPTVVVSRLANSERPGGATELASRLRMLSPAMRVVEMVEAGSAPGPGIESVDGRIERPVAPGSDPEHWGAHEGVASLLRDDLMRLGSPASARPRAAEAPPHPALVRLKQVSEQLRDPGSEGAILNVVLAFAAEHFARVAIFLLRDESVDAIAQKGLERAGGPSEEHFSIVSFPRDGQPDVFRRVLERRSAIVSSLGGEGDERLAMMLGNAAAKQAYVAPIESGGCVAGLLYADNQSAGDSIPDTTALEIVLHEVGLALDGALLRRALADATAIEGP